MARVKLFVVPTPEIADRVLARFGEAGISARALAKDLLLDEQGQPLFEHRRAAVLCPIVDDEQAAHVERTFRGFGVEAVMLDRELEGDFDRPPQRLVVVYRAGNAMQANLMRNALEHFGVPAMVTGDALAGMMAGHDPTAAALVMAPAERHEEARQIVRAVEVENSRKLLPIVNVNELDGDSDYDAPAEPAPAAADWPTCPDCGKRRMTRCPICQTIGADFPPADENFAADSDDETPPFAVICTTCDEPWAAEFFRRCEWCGHDFGHGLVVRETTPRPTEPALPLNSRVTAVLIGLLGLAAFCLAYFVYLAKS